jgi:hypothetical protein
MIKALSDYINSRVKSHQLCVYLFCAGLSVTHALAAEKTESDIRWNAMAPMANMLLTHADWEQYVQAGDNEKSHFSNYPGALAYYLMATKVDDNNLMGPYQAAGTLAILNMPEEAIKYLQLADQRGLWQWIIMLHDEELDAIKHTNEFKQILAQVEARYQQHSQDAGIARFAIPHSVVPEQGWPVVVWLSGYGTEGVSGLDMADHLLQQQAVMVAINGTRKTG